MIASNSVLNKVIYMRGIPVPLVRANQIFLVVGLVLAVVLRQPLLVALELVVGAVALWGGPRLHPVFAVARPLFGSRLQLADREDARMQRFNQALAVAMLVLCSVAFLAGLHTVGYILAAVLAAVALAGAVGFCIGCRLYRFIGPWMRTQA